LSGGFGFLDRGRLGLGDGGAVVAAAVAAGNLSPTETHSSPSARSKYFRALRTRISAGISDLSGRKTIAQTATALETLSPPWTGWRFSVSGGVSGMEFDDTQTDVNSVNSYFVRPLTNASVLMAISLIIALYRPLFVSFVSKTLIKRVLSPSSRATNVRNKRIKGGLSSSFFVTLSGRFFLQTEPSFLRSPRCSNLPFFGHPPTFKRA